MTNRSKKWLLLYGVIVLLSGVVLVSVLFRSNHDTRPFQHGHTKNRAQEYRAQLKDVQRIVENTDWAVDPTALIGLPSTYSEAAVSYFQAAIDLLDGKGALPQRVVFEHKPSSNTSLVFALQADEFPIVVEITGEKSVPVSIMILPAPEVAEKYFAVPDLQQLAQVSLDIQESMQVAEVDTAQFFVPKPGCDSWNLLLPTPRNYPGFRQSCHSTLGWQKHLGRYQSTLRLLKFLDFPDNKPWTNANWVGAIASTPVARDNPVIRWVFLNDARAKQIQKWRAYSLVDANGAYQGTIPYGPCGYTTDTFLRNMDAPFAPSLEVPGEYRNHLPQAPSGHNLLRVPTPQSLQSSEVSAEKSEDWTITEEYYGEQPIPAWLLLADKNSKPFRETFYVKHALDESEHDKWKLVVFSHIEPADLIQVLGAFKGVAAEELPSEKTIERELSQSYIRLNDSFKRK